MRHSAQDESIWYLLRSCNALRTGCSGAPRLRSAGAGSYNRTGRGANGQASGVGWFAVPPAKCAITGERATPPRLDAGMSSPPPLSGAFGGAPPPQGGRSEVRQTSYLQRGCRARRPTSPRRSAAWRWTEESRPARRAGRGSWQSAPLSPRGARGRPRARRTATPRTARAAATAAAAETWRFESQPRGLRLCGPTSADRGYVSIANRRLPRPNPQPEGGERRGSVKRALARQRLEANIPPVQTSTPASMRAPLSLLRSHRPSLDPPSAGNRLLAMPRREAEAPTPDGFDQPRDGPMAHRASAHRKLGYSAINSSCTRHRPSRRVWVQGRCLLPIGQRAAIGHGV